jgi:hypothetical protein
MPTVFIAGYKFRFYSSDVNEPPHVHVIHDDNEAKVWLEPVQLEYNRGYARVELNRVLKLTEQNRARLLMAWNEYFGR